MNEDGCIRGDKVASGRVVSVVKADETISFYVIPSIAKNPDLSCRYWGRGFLLADREPSEWE
jgi:hypothetical protein